MDQANTRPLFSTFVIMTVWVVGTRVVFSMPLTLRANWIFRMTEVRGPCEYFAAIRRSLFVLAVAPVWLATALLLVWIWPWRLVAGHLVVLGLWGMIVAYVGLPGLQKIPFTCSYLPGKSFFHMAFLAAIGLVFLIGKGDAKGVGREDGARRRARFAAGSRAMTYSARVTARLDLADSSVRRTRDCQVAQPGQFPAAGHHRQDCKHCAVSVVLSPRYVGMIGRELPGSDRLDETDHSLRTGTAPLLV